MRELKACILEQRNIDVRTELSIGFDIWQNTREDRFAALPVLLMDVPHEVFRGMSPGQPQAQVQVFWLARDWGQA